MLRKSGFTIGLLALALGSAVPAFAGGFYIELTPPAGNDQRLKDAAFVVTISGCFEPKDTVASATAEGLVNGKRKTVQLSMTKIRPGVWAVKKQWESDGTWMILVNAGLTDTPRIRTTSVVVGAD